MTDEFRRVAVWAGHFPSKARLTRYLEESYEDDADSRPISRFAADQGELFYDHDFVESWFRQKETGSISQLLKGRSFAGSFLPAVESAARDLPLGRLNTVVLVWGGEISSPRPVAGGDYLLHYLGEFDCDPGAQSEEEREIAAIPQRIRLRITRGGPLMIRGVATKAVFVEIDGLTIGSGGASYDRPYLDLTAAPGCGGLSPVQVVITCDQFGQWMIEDLGRNGLTRVDGHILDGERTLPWLGNELSIGGVVFKWEGAGK